MMYMSVRSDCHAVLSLTNELYHFGNIPNVPISPFREIIYIFGIVFQNGCKFEYPKTSHICPLFAPKSHIQLTKRAILGDVGMGSNIALDHSSVPIS